MRREITVKLSEEIDKDGANVCSIKDSEEFVLNKLRYEFRPCNVELVKSEDVIN